MPLSAVGVHCVRSDVGPPRVAPVCNRCPVYLCGTLGASSLRLAGSSRMPTGRERRTVNEALDEPVPIQPRAARARRQRVRKRLFRTAIALLLSGLGLCLIVAWQRDTVRMAEACQRLKKRHLPALQVEIDRLGTLPLFFRTPQADPTARAWPEFIYQDADSIVHLRKKAGEVILAHAVRGPRLLLHRKGRAVILRADGKLSVEWMSDEQFREQLEQQNAYVETRQTQVRRQSRRVP